MRNANSMPISVMTGSDAFLSAWRHTTCVSRWPLAHAVRM